MWHSQLALWVVLQEWPSHRSHVLHPFPGYGRVLADYANVFETVGFGRAMATAMASLNAPMARGTRH